MSERAHSLSLVPGLAELEENPRSRSAKLRVARLATVTGARLSAVENDDGDEGDDDSDDELSSS